MSDKIANEVEKELEHILGQIDQDNMDEPQNTAQARSGNRSGAESASDSGVDASLDEEMLTEEEKMLLAEEENQSSGESADEQLLPPSGMYDVETESILVQQILAEEKKRVAKESKESTGKQPEPVPPGGAYDIETESILVEQILAEEKKRVSREKHAARGAIGAQPPAASKEVHDPEAESALVGQILAEAKSRVTEIDDSQKPEQKSTKPSPAEVARKSGDAEKKSEAQPRSDMHDFDTDAVLAEEILAEGSDVEADTLLVEEILSGEKSELMGADEAVDESPVAQLPLQRPGRNWLGISGLVIFLSAMGALVFNQYSETVKSESLSRLETIALELDTDLRELGHQALLLTKGEGAAFDKITTLKNDINSNIDQLKTSELVTQTEPVAAAEPLNQISTQWVAVSPDVDVVLANRDAIETIYAQIATINDLAPSLLQRADEIVSELIAGEASVDTIIGFSQQRFLTQRLQANANQLASGGPGWETAATQIESDLEQFAQTYDAVAGPEREQMAAAIQQSQQLYAQLTDNTEGVMASAEGYFTLRTSALRLIEASDSLKGLAAGLHTRFKHDEGVVLGVSGLPLTASMVALVALLLMLWAINRHARLVAAVNEQRTQASENAVIKLLDEMGDLAQGDLTVEAEVTDEVTGAIADSINYAVSEMREVVFGIKTAAEEMNRTTETTEGLIAGLLTSSSAQSQEIQQSVQEVNRMSEAIIRMSDSATQSSQQAQVSAEVARRGADAVRNTITGMNTARNRIQETAKQLKRLGESSQQINEIVTLIQDVTERTNILSLNASIQAAMAGEAGRGFAVVAEEVQRLAEQSARASNEITELVNNIQQDVNGAITSMESTTEQVVAGATTADEAGRALNEIESVSQDLLKAITRVAGDAKSESQVAESVANRMAVLKDAATESDVSVSRVAVAMDQMQAVTNRLDESIGGFKLPGNS